MPNVIAAWEYRWRPLLEMTRSESSIIPFPVPCRKVWFTSTARVPCSNTANIGERKTWTQSEFCAGRIPLGDKAPKCIYGVPAHETAKHRAKLGWWLISIERYGCKQRKGAKPVEICWSAPNSPIDLSR